MTKEEYTLLKKRVSKIYYQINKFGKDVDDCVQFVAMHFSSRECNKQSVRQCVVDYYRTLSGRKQLDGTYQRIKTVSTEISDPLSSGSTSSEYDTIYDFEILIGTLDDPMERMIIKLYYDWGLTELEIADVFGLSEGAVSVRMKLARKKIAKRNNLKFL